MQSPGMNPYFGQGMMPHEALTSQYSTLHQERMYLLNALAEEENQGERLTETLSVLQAQIQELEASDPPSNTKKLRQQAKVVRNKVGTCQYRERALAANLANVVAQMEGVKRYQWRNAQQEYAMQIEQAQHHAHLVLMSPARPQFALRSPGPGNLASQMQLMSLNQSADTSVLQRSSLNPYSMAFNPSWSASPPGVPLPEYSQVQHVYANWSPGTCSGERCCSAVEDSQSGIVSSPSSMLTDSPVKSSSPQDWSRRPSSRRRRRAVSLLVPDGIYPTSSGSPLSPTTPRNDGALRRLSLLDDTSAAMQLERKAAEARSRQYNQEE